MGENQQAENRQVFRFNIPKPYKLDHTNLSLDKLDGWWTILISFAGSDTRYVKFLTGGLNANWTAADEDRTRGLTVAAEYPENATAAQRRTADEAAAIASHKIRSELQELLSLIGSYSPEGLFRPITQESSSIQWIIDIIKRTFNLQTRGENLVTGLEMTFKKNAETYQQFYMRLRSFHMESLLPQGTMFKGVALPRHESITPLAEALIVQMWLQKIDPRLPKHIKQTKGFLFSEAKPTLHCIQPELAKMMDTMLAELDGDAAGANIVYTDQLEANRIFNNYPPQQAQNARFQRGARGNRGGWAGRLGNPGRGTYFQRSSQPSQSKSRFCKKCYEVGKEEYIFASHDTTL
jgi:hypothetical protein